MGKKAARARKRRFEKRVAYWMKCGYTINEISHILGCSVPKVVAAAKRIRGARKAI